MFGPANSLAATCPRPAQRLRVVHYRPNRVLVRQLVALEQRAHVLPAAAIGYVPQRVELPLRRELAAERMPQPALGPLDLGVAVRPLEPVRREMPADRPVRVVLHREHERTPDHSVLGTKLEQRPLRL